MSAHTAAGPAPPARTHAEATALFRRPFAPGAGRVTALSSGGSTTVRSMNLGPVEFLFVLLVIFVVIVALLMRGRCRR